MKVKICGITNYEDASAAVDLGVDALGFIFAKSPRRIETETARRIIQSLPPFVMSVGVFVNQKPEEIEETVKECGLDLVQLHGDESPVICERLMPRVIKVFWLKDESSLDGIKPYIGKVRGLLFDTFSKKERGGTGKTFDWDLAIKGKKMGMPVILSGGLNPSNIAEAMRVVKPFAVDVNSGVEKSPGQKDHALIKGLMKTIKENRI